MFMSFSFSGFSGREPSRLEYNIVPFPGKVNPSDKNNLGFTKNSLPQRLPDDPADGLPGVLKGPMVRSSAGAYHHTLPPAYPEPDLGVSLPVLHTVGDPGGPQLLFRYRERARHRLRTALPFPLPPPTPPGGCIRGAIRRGRPGSYPTKPDTPPAGGTSSHTSAA